jgi:hypothetical protein
MKQPSPTVPDHRIFGFTQEGQLRVNLHNGPGLPASGALYSWLVCATSRQLAHKLAELWEQPLTEDEFDVLEQLETSNAETTPFTAEVNIPCEDCGGDGRDRGSLNPHEPEDCPSCHGTGREKLTRNYLSEAWAITRGDSSRPIERLHLAALDAYSRQVVNAYAGKVAA